MQRQSAEGEAPAAAGAAEAEAPAAAGAAEGGRAPSAAQMDLVPRECLVCPITNAYFEDPVVTSDGHTYSRDAIERWLRGKRASPLTNLPLASAKVLPNHALRKVIEQSINQQDPDPEVKKRRLGEGIFGPEEHQAFEMGMEKYALEQQIKFLVDEVVGSNDDSNWGWSHRRATMALIRASSRGHKKVVEVLVDKGARIDLQREDSVTALMAASENGEREVVELLVEKGASVDLQMEDGRTALMLASFEGQREVVEVLVDKGARIDLQTEDGRTALVLCY
jgi:hypothetical protein